MFDVTLDVVFWTSYFATMLDVFCFYYLNVLHLLLLDICIYGLYMILMDYTC